MVDTGRSGGETHLTQSGLRQQVGVGDLGNVISDSRPTRDHIEGTGAVSGQGHQVSSFAMGG